MNPKHYRVVFMGTPDFAVPSLQALIDDVHFSVAAVVTQPDRPAGRNGQLKSSPVKLLALEHGLPILQPEEVRNSPELVKAIQSITPDVIVVVAYGKILPQEILDIPEYGVANVHASLLPKYRGASPIAAAILNGNETTGVTIMKVDLKMDTGPIIARSEPVPIEDNDTTESLGQKLARVGADLLVNTLPRYLEGEIKPTPQDDLQASYVKLVGKEDGKINWNEDEELIARKVRAYYPWPSTYTFWNDKILKILEAEAVPGIDNLKGMVAKIDDRLFIGRLHIDRLQLAGKPAASGREFLRGYPQIVGQSVL